MAERRICSDPHCGDDATKRFARYFYCDRHHAEAVTRAARAKKAKALGPYEERVRRLVTIAHTLDARLAARNEADAALAEVEDLYRRSLLALCRAEGLVA